MQVIYEYGKNNIVKDTKNSCFVLTNNIGGYTSLSKKPISKYQGVYFNKDFDVFKTINNIEVLGCNKINKIVHKLKEVERYREDLKESFIMPDGGNSLIYWLNEESKIKISFDCRKLFDLREWGRHYKIYEQEGKIIVEYNKKKDSRDNSENSEEYKVFIAIATDTDDYKKIKKWREEKYSFDEKRGFCDSCSRYVFDALELKCKTLVAGFSTNKDEAINEVNYILEHFSKSKHSNLNLKINTKIEDEIGMAYLCSQNALNQLVQNISNVKGIYAGIWWFSQFWTRDSAISIKPLITNNKYELVKDILFDYINRLEKDGRILNRIPKSGLGSADGVGWVFKRIGDLIEFLEKNNDLERYLSEKEIKFIKKKLKTAVKNLNKYHTSKGLAINSKKETWIDTCGTTNDVRDGARIEIQTLRLNMYKLLRKLGKMTNDNRTEGEAKKLEKEMLKKVRKAFWNGEYLNDGEKDKTIRPNIFLAYYIYPDLLSKKEWINCFDRVIPRLWCEWGGLTSINKKHKLFEPYHKGVTNKSYHRGDSWYWINNLAALCMNKLDKEKYSLYITDILNASTKEILEQGCLGCHAELSSANKQESWGCLNQTWSNSMFIELIEEIFN